VSSCVSVDGGKITKKTPILSLEVVSEGKRLKRKGRKGITQNTQYFHFEAFIICSLCESLCGLCVKKTFETASFS
jgi:hypothetical protein